MANTAILVLSMAFSCVLAAYPGLNSGKEPNYEVYPFLPPGVCSELAIIRENPKPQQDLPDRVNYTVNSKCFEYMIRATKKKKPLAKKYKVFPTMATWDQAKNNCRMEGMDFAVVKTQEENDILKNYLIAAALMKHEIWLAGNCIANTEMYGWMIRGKQEKFGFTHWAENQPNTKEKEKKCVQISKENFLWENVKCQEKRFYLCEYLPRYDWERSHEE